MKRFNALFMGAALLASTAVMAQTPPGLKKDAGVIHVDATA